MRYIQQTSISTAIILALLSCGCSHSTRAAVVDFGPQFSAAAKKARDATRPDQISSMLKQKATVRLTGIPTLIVSRMAVSHNRLFVLDAFSRAVQIFSAQGAYSGQLGENGQKPGQYITPTDVKATGDTITVDDFTVHRINEYSPEGKFAQSFVYGAQGFGSGRLAYLPTTGQYVLFGNKWLPSPDPSKRTADLVHTYDKSGHYQKSVLRFPDRFLPLNLIACDTPEVYADSAANTVYIALPFDYKQIHKHLP